jgi:MoaA/NifB/PqqE/SkfB family radical SAM enzyme
MAMIINRKEEWGVLQYDTLSHRFSYVKKDGVDAIPYTQNPVLLNLDLTMKCNMHCKHCVTKDFGEMEDLEVSTKMIRWINKTPFMVVVITGGEPFLTEYQDKLITLLRGIRNKGLIIDTNGTITPSEAIIKWIKKTNTLVRVSWDSVRPQDEICLRQGGESEVNNIEMYYKKLRRIRDLYSKGISIAIQSVLHKKNITSLNDMPSMLLKYSIKKWYIQRLIPSYLAANGNYGVDEIKYNRIINRLKQECKKKGIECIFKKDRRHNCVFLLVGKGLLYTQGEKPRQKVFLAEIKNEFRYFDYVSSSDHSERYYG